MDRRASSRNTNLSKQSMHVQNTPGANITQSQEFVEPKAQRHRYSGRVLAVLAFGYIFSLILLFIGAALSPAPTQNDTNLGFAGVLISIGGLLFIAIPIAVLIIDWRGFVTINGWIKWRRMSVWARWVVGYFALGIWPYVLPIYFFQAFQTYRYFKQQEPLERRRKIAQLEAQMGLMPHTEGTCRNCQKPLQVGAEYCAHCGAPVIEQPRICPNCATTTFPDAKWCPKCRYPLDTASQSV